MKRAMIIAVLIFGSTLLAACGSKQVITASSSYREGASDAISTLDAAITSHIDVSRQRQLLRWRLAPSNIVEANGLAIPKAPSDRFAWMYALTQWICAPSGEVSLFALGVLADYGQDLAVVSKAPGEGLVSTLNAIARDQDRLNNLAAKKDENVASSYDDRVAACGTRLKALFESPFDTPLPEFPPPPPTGRPVEGAAGITAPLDLVFAAYDAMKATASLIERETRASVIRAYVAANEKRVSEALGVLTNDPKTAPRGLAPGIDLKKSIDDRMRFHLTSALLSVADSKSMAGMAARREAAQAAATNVQRYRALADMDIQGDVVDALVNAQKKFVAIVANPEGNFDDFMDAMAELRDARDKWVDARDKYRGWRD